MKNSYDPAWVRENLMGPDALQLTDSLTQHMELKPGMRVLDLGCGRGLSSVFMAKEFGVTVFACDLWIDPTENQERFLAQGVDKKTFAFRAEAHSLPFERGFFDAVISVDAYQYFGTDDLYLTQYLLPFLKTGASLGLAVPGLKMEWDRVPDYLKPHWELEMHGFHSALWWKHHWEKTGLVKVEYSESETHLDRYWRSWLDSGNPYVEGDAALVEAGRNDLVFVFQTAHKI